MSTDFYGVRFVLRDPTCPEFNGGLSCTVEFDTDPADDYGQFENYTKLAAFLSQCRVNGCNVLLTLQSDAPPLAEDETPPAFSGQSYELGRLEIDEEFYGPPFVAMQARRRQ